METNNQPSPDRGININLQEAILRRLKIVESKLTELNLIQKTVLTFAEAITYLDLSESFLYKLTSQRQIPHFKPHGKKIYFERTELDKWRMTNPVKTMEQIQDSATSYTVRRAA